MDLPYMKRVRFYLSLFGGWPYKIFGQQDQTLPFRKSRFVFSYSTTALICGILYIKANMKALSFIKLGHSYLTVFMNSVCFQRLTMPWFKIYHEVARDFVVKMHLFHHKHRTENALMVSNRVDKICEYYSKYLYCQMAMGILLFNLTPLYFNYSHGMFSANRPVNGTFEHAVYYQFPFNYSTNFAGFLVLALFNVLISFDCGSLFCTYDLFLCIMVFHLWGHLKILNYNLTHFPRPAPLSDNPSEIPHMYSEEESSSVTEMLKDNINHHRFIKDFMAQTSKAFGLMLCFYYAFHMVSGCVLLLECSRMDTEALGRYGVLTMIVFQQLIQVSIVFELLGSESDHLKHSVYGLPWECMDSKNRKIVLFYLYNVQSPLSLKALGVVPVGVRTMAGLDSFGSQACRAMTLCSEIGYCKEKCVRHPQYTCDYCSMCSAILKTSFSYFMLLRTVAIEE